MVLNNQHRMHAAISPLLAQEHPGAPPSLSGRAACYSEVTFHRQSALHAAATAPYCEPRNTLAPPPGCSYVLLAVCTRLSSPSMRPAPYPEPRNTLAPRPARVLSPIASLNLSKGNTLPADVEHRAEP